MFYFIRQNYGNIFDLQYELKIKGLIAKIDYSYYLYNGQKFNFTVKKPIMRYPNKEDYEKLFNELGLSNEAINCAIESAKLKLKRNINKI
jgi:hypothetical protein